MTFWKIAYFAGWGMLAAGIVALLVLPFAVKDWTSASVMAWPLAFAVAGVALMLVAYRKKGRQADGAVNNRDGATKKRGRGMTTWDRKIAKVVYDRLRDVDFYIAQARVCIGEGLYDLAKERIKAAVAAKYNAMGGIPGAENAVDDFGVDFVELYQACSRKDELAYAVQKIKELPPPQRRFYTSYDLLGEQVETAIRELERIRDKYWPAPDVCSERFDEIIAILNRLHAALTSVPPTVDSLDIWGSEDLLTDAQRALFQCLYPESQIDMSQTYLDLWAMDGFLGEAYSWVKAARAERHRIDGEVAINCLGWAESAKHHIQRRLRERFPGIESGFPPPLGGDWGVPNPYPAGSGDLPDWPDQG